MSHPLPSGKWIRSPGGNFAYSVLGPCCRLFDREELPWPCCRLAWRSKEPSWNRVGKRFVSDMSAARSPNYAVRAVDQWGGTWNQILTLYQVRLTNQEKAWWISKGPEGKPFPKLESP